jgi:hypothetical protein
MTSCIRAIADLALTLVSCSASSPRRSSNDVRKKPCKRDRGAAHTQPRKRHPRQERATRNEPTQTTQSTREDRLEPAGICPSRVTQPEVEHPQRDHRLIAAHCSRA